MNKSASAQHSKNVFVYDSIVTTKFNLNKNDIPSKHVSGDVYCFFSFCLFASNVLTNTSEQSDVFINVVALLPTSLLIE